MYRAVACLAPSLMQPPCFAPFHNNNQKQSIIIHYLYLLWRLLCFSFEDMPPFIFWHCRAGALFLHELSSKLTN